MPALVRDRVTFLAYAQVCCYAYALYALGPCVSLLRDEQHVSRAVAGLHSTGAAAGSVAIALIAPATVRRLGHLRTMWLGVGLVCLAVVVFSASRHLAVTLTGTTLLGIGGTFVVIPVAVLFNLRHGAAGPAVLTEANAIASAIGTVSPLVVAAAVAVVGDWRPGMLAVLAVAGLCLALRGRGDHGITGGAPEQHHDVRRRLPRRYWFSWVMVTAGIGVEFCLALWVTDALRTRYGLSASIAAIGVTAVVAGMCIGRAVGGRLALRMPLDTLLYVALAVCGAGFAVFWVTRSATVAMAGLVIAGLGVAVLYPLGLSRAIAVSDGLPDLASARVGIGAGVAAGSGPFALGAVADHVGVHNAFLIVPLLLLVCAGGLALSGRLTPAESAPA